MYSLSFFPFLPTPLKRKHNDKIWKYHMDGDLTIFIKDYDAAEEGLSQIEAFATIAIHSWWQLGEIKYASRITFR